jgi:phasin family protein
MIMSKKTSAKPSPANEPWVAMMNEWLALTQSAMAQTQRLVALQNELARTLFEESIRASQALADTSDPSAQQQQQQAFAQRVTQQVIAAMNEVAQLTVKSQAEMNQFFARTLETSNALWQQWWQQGNTERPNAAPPFPWGNLQSGQSPWPDPSKTLEAMQEATRMTTEMWQKMAGIGQSEKPQQ